MMQSINLELMTVRQLQNRINLKGIIYIDTRSKEVCFGGNTVTVCVCKYSNCFTTAFQIKKMLLAISPVARITII